MTFKGFSKLVKPDSITKLRSQGGRIAIDAMTEIYRACAGKFGASILTDARGIPTKHISCYLAIIRKLQLNKAYQIWVFDAPRTAGDTHHNINKVGEMMRRQKVKLAAKKKAIDLEKLFDSDDDEEDIKKNKEEIGKAERAGFSITDQMTNDLKLILNYLNIHWIEAPSGYEGEHIAAYLTYPGVDIADSVLSNDPDVLLYGGKTMLRRDTRPGKGSIIMSYDSKSVLSQLGNISMNNMRKIAMILGTDFAPKTKGIGPKTVLKKLNNTELTAEQKYGILEYSKKVNSKDVIIHNKSKTPFSSHNIDGLKTWLKYKGFANKSIESKLKSL